MRRERVALAVALGLLSIGAGVLVTSEADLADPLSLGLASLWLEISLTLLALAGGLLSTRPLRARLGLAAGRLRAPQLALLVVGTVGISHGVDGLLDLAGLRDGSPLEEFERNLAGARGAGLAAALLGVGLAPGIGEELLCRGLVQRGLEPIVGPALAVVAAALVFGALHLDPVHALGAALLGLYLGAAAALADSVRASMLCHAANNLLAVGAAAFLRGPVPGPTTTVLGFAVAAVCLWLVWRSPGLQRQHRSDDS